MSEPLYPHHASITHEELRNMWHTNEPRWHDEPFGWEAVTSNAMTAAKDAAQAFLEGVRLKEEITMSQWCWDFWRETLGGYDMTLPSGTRIGKRWTREELNWAQATRTRTMTRFIGTYVPSKRADTVGIVWTKVNVVKNFGE